MAALLAARQGLCSHYSSLFLLHHACSCSHWGPLLPGPSPQPPPQRKDWTNNSSFFSFFLLYTNIYRVLYTSLHRQCHSEHIALCGQGPNSCRGSPRAWPYLQRPSQPSAGPGARAVGGCENREAGSTAPLPQAVEWTGNSQLICSFHS